MVNWDPSKSLPDDDRDTFRASGNAAQRRKALRKAQGSRCRHGVLIVGDVDPEQKCPRCATEMSASKESSSCSNNSTAAVVAWCATVIPSALCAVNTFPGLAAA